MLFRSKTMVFNRKHKICLVKQWFLTSHIPTFQHSNNLQAGHQKRQRVATNSWNVGMWEVKNHTVCLVKIGISATFQLLPSKSYGFCKNICFYLVKVGISATFQHFSLKKVGITKQNVIFLLKS